MLLFVNSCQIDSTKIAIVGMVFWLPPNHWNAKLQRFSWTLSPLPQMFNTSFTDCKWRPWFVLITKLYAKIGMISFLNKLLLHDFFHQLFWTRHKYNKMNQDDFYKIKILMPFIRSWSWCHLQDLDLDAIFYMYLFSFKCKMKKTPSAERYLGDIFLPVFLSTFRKF